MNARNHELGTRSVTAGALATLLLLGIALAAPTEVVAKDCKACKTVARLALKSGLYESVEEYYLNVAKANTDADREDRREGEEEARETLIEDRDLAREQYRARRDLCEALNECYYDPDIDPENFLSAAETIADPNPYWPFIPGKLYRYEGETEDGVEIIEVSLTGDTREILGVECSVIRDTVWVDGEVVEDTWDWFAQDTDGNVWYFGELSFEYEDGEISALEGSWEAGEDGAKPGIVMKAMPEVGCIYRQEFLLGDAEDAAEVESLDESVTVAYGSFDGCLMTGEFTPLDPEVYEHKFYAAGVGLILEVDEESGESVELIEILDL